MKGKLKHPAQYSPQIVAAMIERLDGVRGTILDPFAGPGRSLHRFDGKGRTVIGYEIEQPWADASPGYVKCVDSTKMPRRTSSVAAIVTSPDYGNRFSDHHDAKDQSRRRSYTHDIREQTGDRSYVLADNNSGNIAFGYAYQLLHRKVMAECLRVLRPGAPMLLNTKDFYRGEEFVQVTLWHLTTCVSIGFEWRNATPIPTSGLRHGANRELRVDFEWMLELRKPEAP